MKIALIAHDKKKEDMINLAVRYREVLAPHELFATGTTGTMVMGETGLRITRMKSGPLGGDQQIGSMIAEGKLDLVIFLRDRPDALAPSTACCTEHHFVYPRNCILILHPDTAYISTYTLIITITNGTVNKNWLDFLQNINHQLNFKTTKGR